MGSAASCSGQDRTWGQSAWKFGPRKWERRKAGADGGLWPQLPNTQNGKEVVNTVALLFVLTVPLEPAWWP